MSNPYDKKISEKSTFEKAERKTVLNIFTYKKDEVLWHTQEFSNNTRKTARSFIYSKENTSMFEEAREQSAIDGAFNSKDGVPSGGWKTYNFEVEDLHTYVAGGFKVHNDSTPTLIIADAEFRNKFGYEFSESPEDIDKMMGAISDGTIKAYGDYVGLL